MDVKEAVEAARESMMVAARLLPRHRLLPQPGGFEGVGL
jgi:hypothetical protein